MRSKSESAISVDGPLRTKTSRKGAKLQRPQSKLLRITNYSDNIRWCGAVLSAERRRWGHRRYRKSRHYNL